MRRIVERWLDSEKDANYQLLHGKTASSRIGGFIQSEKNEAKWLLSAILPVILLSFFLPAWPDSSSVQKLIWVCAISWASLVLVGGFFLLVRNLINSLEKQDG